VIVEGYTDALMAHQAGYDNVVASLGTALTPGQVALLNRYQVRRIALAYDVDPAGQKAGTFGVTALQGLIGQLASTEGDISLDDVRVVRLPDGKDPDEVLRDMPDRWREEVRTAQPIVEYLVDIYARTYELRTPGGKMRFVDALMPTLRGIGNPVLRDAYLQLIRQRSGVEEGTLLQALRSGAPVSGLAASSVREGRFTADAVIGSADSLPVSEILRGVLPQEAEFLRLLLLVPEIQLKVVDSIGPDQLPSTVARELFRAVVLAREPDDSGVHPPFSLTQLVASLDPETAALAQAVVARRDPNPRDLSEAELAYELERLTIDLEERSLDERADYIASALAEAEQARPDDTAARESINQLLRESQALNDQRKSLHRRRDQTRLLTRPNQVRARPPEQPPAAPPTT
jgi:DNA primase